MTKFLNFFRKKNRNFFEIFFFESCSFDAKTSAKFFFGFGQIFGFYFCKGIVLFQKKIDFFLLFLVIYAQKNGFRPLRERSSHISTLWKSLVFTSFSLYFCLALNPLQTDWIFRAALFKIFLRLVKSFLKIFEIRTA